MLYRCCELSLPMTMSFAPASRRSGFTLVELLVSIAIIAVLVSLLFLGYNSALIKTRQLKSTANYRTIGLGFSLFLNENNQFYPGFGMNAVTRWLNRVGAYMDLGPVESYSYNGVSYPIYRNAYYHRVFYSPLTDPRTYALGSSTTGLGVYGGNPEILLLNTQPPRPNYYGVHALQIRRPSNTLLLAERFSGRGGPGGCMLDDAAPYPKAVNGMSANYRSDQKPEVGEGLTLCLFVDGHIETVALERLNPWPRLASGGADEAQLESGGVRFSP